jgi:hypothetical protein
MEKDQISLPLALEDYVPIILFAVGLVFSSRMIARECNVCGKLAFLGTLLVALGGIFKASWKLVQALGGADIPLLNHSLFILMSAGFVCIAWAAWRSRKENSPVLYVAVPAAVILLSYATAAYFAFARESRAWFFILLGVTTIFNLWLSGQMIWRAMAKGLWLTVALFVFNALCVLALSRISDQTVTMQWAKQLINTASQAAFCYAAWRLSRASFELK